MDVLEKVQFEINSNGCFFEDKKEFILAFNLDIKKWNKNVEWIDVVKWWITNAKFLHSCHISTTFTLIDVVVLNQEFVFCIH